MIFPHRIAGQGEGVLEFYDQRGRHWRRWSSHRFIHDDEIIKCDDIEWPNVDQECTDKNPCTECKENFQA